MVYYYDATALGSNYAVNGQDFRWVVVHDCSCQREQSGTCSGYAECSRAWCTCAQISVSRHFQREYQRSIIKVFIQ
ncbi:MAG: hypothetical protein SPJ71_03915 [Candidatus Limisoma sp.]|nr:hypothetical protein [Bacteroidales bacterium]MDY5893704.1 hypothetical protein [Candidatus Limisoma sp.]